MQKDIRIDKIIETLPIWQQEICNYVREIIHNADTQVIETIKRTNRPYFTLNGNICALQSTKDHVNIFIYDPIIKDPKGLINQGVGNKTARSIQVYENDKIDKTALFNLFKDVIENNKKDGWRKLQKEKL